MLKLTVPFDPFYHAFVLCVCACECLCVTVSFSFLLHHSVLTESVSSTEMIHH